MQTISVALGKRSYPIWVDKGLHTMLPELFRSQNLGQKWVIITHPSIRLLIGQQITDDLTLNGFDVEIIEILEGEDSKSLLAIQSLYSQLIKRKCDRKSTLIALGGGVIGDITGFVASTFMRGINYIQIPTTLLAMVDSAIGGKTGVNLPEGKNLVGAIWQPTAVISDIHCLQSLPKREVVSALGEVIKYGLILDKTFFNELKENLDKLESLDSAFLTKVIAHCSKLKADIVSQDEAEGGLRQILNFGHTIGHALEKHFGNHILRHGEAVSFGMLVAGQLSTQFANLNNADFAQMKKLIISLDLPELPPINADKIWQLMQSDKKNNRGKIHFVLLDNIGKTTIRNDIDKESIINSINQLNDFKECT
jgi:3-dehydroquinate synthase